MSAWFLDSASCYMVFMTAIYKPARVIKIFCLICRFMRPRESDPNNPASKKLLSCVVGMHAADHPGDHFARQLNYRN